MYRPKKECSICSPEWEQQEPGQTVSRFSIDCEVLVLDVLLLFHSYQGCFILVFIYQLLYILPF